MPPLTDEWIDKQLELCEKATRGPWAYRKGLGCKDIGPRTGVRSIYGVLYTSGLSKEAEDTANAQLCAAAREGYPATLEALQAIQGELRTVYAILRGLHMAIDALAHENIKECLGQLLMAGAEWMEEATDG